MDEKIVYLIRRPSDGAWLCNRTGYCSKDFRVANLYRSRRNAQAAINAVITQYDHMEPYYSQNGIDRIWPRPELEIVPHILTEKPDV